MADPLPVVARCTKCGREFVTLGGSDIDAYPPQGWQPPGGWGKWRGEAGDDIAPVCGGAIIPVTELADG